MTKLLQLKEKYPDIKYTFFCNPNFEHWYDECKLLRLVKRRLHLLWIKKEIFAFKRHKLSWNFDITKHKDRCNFISKHIENNTFEIWIHGYNHYQKYILPAAEFLNLSSDENIHKIKSSESLFEKSWIKYTKAFRSPAWWTNEFLEDNLNDLWYKYISLLPNLSTLNYKKEKHIFYIPQNFSIEHFLNNSIPHLKEHNYFFIKWHLYDKLENWIREDTIKKLDNAISLLKNDYNIIFIRLEDLENLYLDGKIQWINEI